MDGVYTKLLWWLGVVAAFLLVILGMAATSLGEFGGDPGAGAAAALILGGALITALTFSYRHVFKDRWPN